MLCEKGRFKNSWELAVGMVEGVEGAGSDPQVVAMAMRVCWKAQQWPSLLRMLGEEEQQH